MAPIKRTLSDASLKQQCSAKRMRAVCARTDSGLRRAPVTVQAGATTAPSLAQRDNMRQLHRSVSSACRSVIANSGRQQKSSRDKPSTTGRIQRCEAQKADLQQRKLARQIKWSQRTLGGRRVSAACFGTSSCVVANQPQNQQDEGRNSTRPLTAPGPRVTAVKDERVPAGVRASKVQQGATAAPSISRRGITSAAAASAAGNTSRCVDKVDGAAAAGGGVATVRLNRATMRRLQMRQSTVVASVGRRCTLLAGTSSTAAATGGALRRQTTAGATSSVKGRAGVTANKKQPPPLARRNVAVTAGAKRPSPRNSVAAPVRGSPSALHRARPVIGVKASIKSTKPVQSGRKLVQSSRKPVQSSRKPVQSGRKPVRRRSFPIDDEVVAATPHIHRPVIAPRTHDAASTPSVSGDTAATALSAGGSTARLTPVGFDTSPTAFPLQLRLKKWLTKRGKSLSAFRHLQCFHGANDGSTCDTPRKRAKSTSDDGSLRKTPLVKRQNISTDWIANRPSKQQQQKVGVQQLNTTCTVIEEECDSDDHVTQSPVDAESHVTDTGVVSVTEPCDKGPGANDANVSRAVCELRELQSMGLPVEQLEGWLLQLSRVPGALQLAGYWLCHAAAAETRGQLDQLLDSFRQATAASAEPVCELVDGLESLVRRATGIAALSSTDELATNSSDAIQDQENVAPTEVPSTPFRARRTPRKPLLDSANVFRSSAVKYALYDRGQRLIRRLAVVKTGKNDAENDTCDADQTNVARSMIITPVRRSTRRRCAANVAASPLVAAAKCADPHLAIFDSLDAISDVLRQSALFAKNSALKLTP